MSKPSRKSTVTKSNQRNHDGAIKSRFTALVIRSCSALLCLILLSACQHSSRENNRRDLPDGSLFIDGPLDHKAATLQRKLAEIDEIDTDFVPVSISNYEELKSVGLRAYNQESAPYLAHLIEALNTGIKDADYFLTFDEKTGPFPKILNAKGLSLIAIARIDRAVPTCTTRVPTARQKNEDLIAYGGRAGTLTEGICGGIAAAHSFLNLNLYPRGMLVSGNFFKEDSLKKIQGENRRQMTKRRLQRVHADAGASFCRTNGGDFKTTGNPQGLRRFNKELSRFVNDPKHNWDCTLFVRSTKNNKDTLAHFEHVISVSRSGNKTSINTTNGFDQGNQKDKVPVSPGTNTWTSTPGGQPAFKLTQCTGSDGKNTVKGTPKAGKVNYLCCRAP